MGSSSTQTTQQKSERSPWAPAQPDLQKILDNVGQYMGQSDMFAPTQGATTQSGIQALTNIGNSPTATQTAGNAVVQGAGQGYQTGLDQLQKTANGGFLNANPYLDAALKAANQRTTEQVNSQFEGAGRFGSGANTLALGRALGEQNAAAYLNNYNTERQNQQGAANTLLQGGYAGVNAGQTVDQARGSQAQALLNAGNLSDTYAQGVKQAPITATQWSAGIVPQIASLGGTTDTTGTTTQRQNPNMAGIIGGGLMTGLGLMTGNPMMAMSGAGGMGSGLFGGGLGGANNGSGNFWGW